MSTPPPPPPSAPHPGPGPDLSAEAADAGAGVAPQPEPVVDERRRVVSGGIWLAAGAVVPMASTLVLSVLVARMLGPTAQGEQSVIALVASVMVSLVVLSANSTAVQVLGAARGRGDAGEIAWLSRTSTHVQLALGLLCAVALVLIGAHRDFAPAAWYFAALTLLLDSAAWSMAARVAARDGWSEVGARRLVSQVLAPLLGAFGLVVGWGVTGIFATQALAAGGLVLALLPLQRRERLAPSAGAAHQSAASLARLWGVFALSIVVTQLVERRIEILIMEASSTHEQIAMYSTAYNVFSVTYYFCSSVASAAVPSIAATAAAGHLGAVTGALNRAARLIFAISVVLGAAVAAVGPALVELAYGPAYRQAADLVPWLCLALVVAPVAQLARIYWTGVGRLRAVLVCGGAGLVTDLVVAALLVPRLGAEGAVTANLAGTLTSGVLLVLHTRRALPVFRTGWVRPLVASGVALLAGGAAAVAASPGGVLGLLAGGVVFVVVTLLVTRVAMPVAPEDVEWLAAALPGRVAPLVRWAGTPQVAVRLARRATR